MTIKNKRKKVQRLRMIVTPSWWISKEDLEAYAKMKLEFERTVMYGNITQNIKL